MSTTGDGVPRQRTLCATSRSSEAGGVAVDMSDRPRETGKRCRDEDLGNIEGPPDKQNVHSFKDKHNIKDAEKMGRSKWSKEEDEILIRMVNKHGLESWPTIAGAIPGRIPKQCQIRWKFALDPGINKDAWSQQEELRLIRAHQIYGTKWTEMVKHFPGRTTLSIRSHWRGSMSRKLDSYLASGLLETIPDLLETVTVPQNSDSDILKDTNGPSHKKQPKKSKKGSREAGTSDGENSEQLPGVPETLPVLQNSDANYLKDTDGSSDRNQQSLKSKLGGDNTDISEGENPDFKHAKGLDDCSAKSSERMTAGLKQRARARKRLDFLSSPVELKVSTTPTSLNPQTSLQKGKQSPSMSNISPSNVVQDDSGDVPSECANAEFSQTSGYHPTDVRPLDTSDPFLLELHQTDVLDLLDMSYCDGLMIDPSGSPSDCK